MPHLLAFLALILAVLSAQAQTVPQHQKCGAVAYTLSGGFGGAFGVDSCEEAEKLAVEECQRHATAKSDKDDCAVGPQSSRSAWFYIQFCKDGRRYTTNVITALKEGDLVTEAERRAQAGSDPRHHYPLHTCKMVPNGKFHSAGDHTTK